MFLKMLLYCNVAEERRHDRHKEDRRLKKEERRKTVNEKSRLKKEDRRRQ